MSPTVDTEPSEHCHWLCKDCTSKKAAGRVTEVVILVVLITIAWGLFSIPSIFYFAARKVCII